MTASSFQVDFFICRMRRTQPNQDTGVCLQPVKSSVTSATRTEQDNSDHRPSNYHHELPPALPAPPRPDVAGNPTYHDYIDVFPVSPEENYNLSDRQSEGDIQTDKAEYAVLKSDTDNADSIYLTIHD